MNFEPLRRLQSKLSVAFVAAAALFLTSCGGGGATSSPGSVGVLQLLPATTSIYAGVPYTFNIVGGRKPYLVTSSEPTLVELNFTTNSNEFTFVARNPGVVDVGLDPNEVPRRTVNIQVRDSNGTSVSNPYSVLQNFYTGYQESYSSTCTAAAGATVTPQACSGTDTIVTLFPTSNGALYGNRQFQFDKVRGDYQFVVEDPAVTPQLVNRINVRSDHEGKARVRLRVNAVAPTQLATYTVTDILTGATTNMVFLIVQQPVADAITLLPTDITFTGTLDTTCGAGTADIFVFGGTPPYTVTGSLGVSVTPTTVSASGGRFTISVGSSSPPCRTGTNVVVSDSRGAVATLPVTIAQGTETVPVPTPPPSSPLTASPTTVASLACGASAQVTAAGGVGPISVTSLHGGITATISGSTVTMTRRAVDIAPPYPTSGTVNITDGATIVAITITATPATCP